MRHARKTQIQVHSGGNKCNVRANLFRLPRSDRKLLSIEQTGGEWEMERTILHSDINCCYAAIEHLHHPELAGEFMRNIGEIISSNRKKMKLSQPMLAELLQEEFLHRSLRIPV